MATEKQIEANRKNAQLSTGPKTPEGKEIVRLNALKHGLRADSFEVAPGENPAEFAARLAGWSRVYAPANAVESNLVRRAVVLSWRIDRATRFENSALARRVRESVMACECEDDDAGSLIEAAGLAFFDAGKDGEKLRRYQFALERGLHRIMAELAKFPGVTSNRKPTESLDGFEAVPEDDDRHVEVPSEPADSSQELRPPDRITGPERDCTVPSSAHETALVEVRQESRTCPDDAPVTRCESPEAPAPNKANSPAGRPESRPQNRPIKTDLFGRVKLSSVLDKKQAVSRRPYINPFKSGGSGWLDLSIDTR